MDRNATRPAGSSRGFRIGNACIGVLFVAIAIVIVAASLPALGIGQWLAALGIGALGMDAIVGAARGRHSLLSRIGPLP